MSDSSLLIKNFIKEKISQLLNVNDFIDFLYEFYSLYQNEIVKKSEISKKELFLLPIYDITENKNIDFWYYKFRIPKKSGKFRTIHAPKKELKLIFKNLNFILQSLFTPKENVIGFVPNKNIVHNAQIHVNKKYIFNIDLEDYFYSFDNQKVYSSLVKELKLKEPIARFIAEISTIKHNKKWVLPQGSPISPILSNIASVDLDKDLKKLAVKFQANYTRYVDDITFSSNQPIFSTDFQKSIFIKELFQIIQNHYFKVNFKKVRIQTQHQSQSVTGLIVNKKVNISRKFIKNLKMWMYFWKKYGYEKTSQIFFKDFIQKNPNCTKIPNFFNFISGKIQFIKMIKGENNSSFLKIERQFLTLQAKTLRELFKNKTFEDNNRSNHFNFIISQNIKSKISEDSLFKNSVMSYYNFIQSRYSIRSHDNVFRPFQITNPSILKQLMLDDNNIIHYLNLSNIAINDENIRLAKEYIQNNFNDIYNENNFKFQKVQLRSLIDFDNNPNSIINVFLEYSKFHEVKVLTTFLNGQSLIDSANSNRDLILQALDIIGDNNELSKAIFDITNGVSNYYASITTRSSVSYDNLNFVLGFTPLSSNKTMLQSKLDNLAKAFNITSNEDKYKLNVLTQFLAGMRYMTNMSVEVMQKYANENLNANNYLKATVSYGLNYVEQLDNEYRGLNSEAYNSIFLQKHTTLDNRTTQGLDIRSLVVLQRMQYYFLVNPLIKNIFIGNANSTLLDNIEEFHKRLKDYNNKAKTFNIMSVNDKTNTYHFMPTVGLSITQYAHTFFMEMYDNQQKQIIKSERPELDKGATVDVLIRQPFTAFLVNETVKLQFNFGDSTIDYQFQKGEEDTLFFNNKQFDKTHSTKQDLLHNELQGNRDLSVTLQLGVAYSNVDEVLSKDPSYHELLLQIPQSLQYVAKEGVEIVDKGFTNANNVLISIDRYWHQTLYTVKLRDKNTGEEYTLHLMKKLNPNDTEQSRALFLPVLFDSKGAISKRDYRELLDINVPFFGLKDIKKDKNGNNYIYEIITNYHLINYFGNFQEDLSSGKPVLIDVSVDGLNEESSFGRLTASFPINSIGSTAVNRVGTSNNIQDIEELNEVDDLMELQSSLMHYSDSTEEDLSNNELLQKQLNKNKEEQDKKLLRIVNKLDFDKPFVDFERATDIYFVDYSNKKLFYSDGGFSLSGALGLPVVLPDGKYIDFAEFERKAREIKIKMQELQKEIQDINSKIDEAENSDIDANEKSILVTRLYVQKNKISERFIKIKKEYNNLLNEHKSDNGTIDISPNNIDNDFIQLLILPTSNLLDTDKLGYEYEYIGFGVKAEIAKRLYIALNKKLREGVNNLPDSEVIELKDKTRLRKDIIVELINIANSKDSNKNIFDKIQELLGEDLNSLLDTLVNKDKTLTKLSNKNKISYKLTQEDVDKIKKSIYLDVFNDMFNIAYTFRYIINYNNEGSYIDASMLAFRLSSNVETLNDSLRVYNRIVFDTALEYQDNFRKSVTYLSKVLNPDEGEANSLLKRFKANVNVNFNLLDTEEAVYRGNERIKMKKDARVILNTLSGKVARSENNKSRYLLHFIDIEEYIPVKGLEFRFIKEKLEDYSKDNRENVSRYDEVAINKIIDKTIDLLLTQIELTYNDYRSTFQDRRDVLIDFLMIDDDKERSKYFLRDDKFNLLTLLTKEQALSKLSNLRNDITFRKHIAHSLFENIKIVEGDTTYKFNLLHDYFYNLKSINKVTGSVLFNLFILPNTAMFESEVNNGAFKPSYESKDRTSLINVNYKKSNRSEVGFYDGETKIEGKKPTLPVYEGYKGNAEVATTTTETQQQTTTPQETQQQTTPTLQETIQETTPTTEQETIEPTIQEPTTVNIEEPKREKVKVGINKIIKQNVEISKFEIDESENDNKKEKEKANKKIIQDIVTDIDSALFQFVDTQKNKAKHRDKLNIQDFDLLVDAVNNINKKYNYKDIDKAFNEIEDEVFKNQQIELLNFYQYNIIGGIENASEFLLETKKITKEKHNNILNSTAIIRKFIPVIYSSSNTDKEEINRINKILNNNQTLENINTVVLYLNDILKKSVKNEPISKDEKELFNKIIDEINKNKYYENKKFIEMFDLYDIKIVYDEKEVEQLKEEPKVIEIKEAPNRTDKDYVFGGAIVKNSDGSYSIERNIDSFYRSKLENIEDVTFWDIVNLVGNVNNLDFEEAISDSIILVLSIYTRNTFTSGYDFLYEENDYSEYGKCIKLKFVIQSLNQIEDEALRKKMLWEITTAYALDEKDIDKFIKSFEERLINRPNDLFIYEGTNKEDIIYYMDDEGNEYRREDIIPKIILKQKEAIINSIKLLFKASLGQEVTKEDLDRMPTVTIPQVSYFVNTYRGEDELIDVYDKINTINTLNDYDNPNKVTILNAHRGLIKDKKYILLNTEDATIENNNKTVLN